MKITDLNVWETEFIKNFIEREYEIHDIDNWETEEEFNNHSAKLNALADKFAVFEVKE
jgi:hypothetical protein